MRTKVGLWIDHRKATIVTVTEDDLKLMAELNNNGELKDYAKGLGWEDKAIKKEL